MFRGLVARAWKHHCRQQRRDPGDGAAMDAWRREQMQAVAGVSSTKDASPTRDFTPIMARFEAILGDSIYWHTRLEGDRLRRVRWSLDKLMTERDVSQEYLQGIARQMFDSTEVARLTPEQIENLVIALKRHLGIYGGPRGSSPARKEGALAAA